MAGKVVLYLKTGLQSLEISLLKHSFFLVFLSAVHPGLYLTQLNETWYNEAWGPDSLVSQQFFSDD